MSTKAIRTLTAATVLAFAASASHAGMENAWNYNLTLNWVANSAVFSNVDAFGRPIARDGGWTANDEGTLLSWGALTGGYLNPTSNPDDNRSALLIEDTPAKGTINTNGGSVAANMFTHYNSPIWSNFPSLEKADLSVSIELTSIDGLAKYKIDQTFEVYFKETPNTGQLCDWTTSGLCDDDVFAIVSISPTLDNFTYPFSMGGWDYTFNYFETSDYLKPLSTAACQDAGIFGRACYGFTTPESMATAVQFGFSITAVPEPETYAMLLAGLGLVGITARRRRLTIRN